MTMTATLGPHLPYLRRYARSLAGSQTSGDAYVRASLEAILAGKAELIGDVAPRIALYRIFHKLWSTTAGDIPSSSTDTSMTVAEQRLRQVLPGNREAILLTSVEGFSVGEAAFILEWPVEDVETAITAASQMIDRDLASRVLIVEDELVIALDLENITIELGHTVTGIATTRAEAVLMAREQNPDLILTDIQLADGSSGLDATAEILNGKNIPVIFITAFPECLLTGERPEPTYLIQKPFSRETVRATIGQALFFHKPLKVTKVRPVQENGMSASQAG